MDIKYDLSSKYIVKWEEKDMKLVQLYRNVVGSI